MVAAKDLSEEIKQAIGAHGQWKMRLLDAIETGQSEWTPEKVRPNCNCAFGKWLESFNETEKTTHYRTVYGLHTDFHVEAARILELALNQLTEEARIAVQSNSTYSDLTQSLVLAMTTWMRAEGDRQTQSSFDSGIDRQVDLPKDAKANSPKESSERELQAFLDLLNEVEKITGPSIRMAAEKMYQIRKAILDKRK
ncbi:MAG: CZB domain-containing protein [bacterium]|nr:CZB domain-containing protein [bacterium]